MRCVWVATGNNPSFSHEMSRRLVRIRLDAKTDEPWRRETENFRHPDLRRWATEHRSALIGACLTLIQAWIERGRPDHPRTLGSFEHWSRVIGGILEVAQVPGFLGNLDSLYQANDAEGLSQRTFITAWWERYGVQPTSTTELFALASACDPSLPLGEGSERSQKTKLGLLIGRLRDRVFRVGEQSVRVTALGIRHQAQQWALLPKSTSRVVEPQNGERGNVGEPFPGSKKDRGGEPGERGEPFSGRREGPAGNVGQRSPLGSPEISASDQGAGERGEPGEPFSTPLCTRAHTRMCEGRENGSPGSSGSPSHGPGKENSGEGGGEPRVPGSPAPTPPAPSHAHGFEEWL